MAYQPPFVLGNTTQNKKKDEDLLDLGYSYSDKPEKNSKNESLQNRKKKPISSDPANSMISLGSSMSYNEDDFEENSKENTSLLGSGTQFNAQKVNNKPNVYQSKQNMQRKKDYKNDNMSSERSRTFFEKYIFDAFKYQVYFDTNTQEIQDKLIDALWPFLPENQFHLIENDAESIREFKKKPNSQELYGPIWIMVTLIIELCILGHLLGAIQLQGQISQNSNQPQFILDQQVISFANKSIQMMFKTVFLLSMLFILNPFIGYLIFKNRGAIEVSFVNLLQTYGYSLAIFVPVALLNCFLLRLNRLRIFLVLVSGAISLYYIYKETKEYITKYIDDETFKYLSGYMISSTVVFQLLLIYYFLAV